MVYCEVTIKQLIVAGIAIKADVDLLNLAPRG